MKIAKLVLDRTLAAIICVLMVAMVLNVLWQVKSRFFHETPSSYTEELARYMMIWLGVLGGAYGFGQKSHLALDLLSSRLSGARRKISEVFIAGSVLAFALAVLVGGGIRLVWITFSLGQTSGAMQLPLGYLYLVVPVAGFCVVFYTLGWLRDALAGHPHTETQSDALN
jgi:TRAP-type C4-dicarboxylate transport system permease small subunit